MLAKTMAFNDMIGDLKALLFGALTKVFGQLLVMAFLDVPALVADQQLRTMVSMTQ